MLSGAAGAQDAPPAEVAQFIKQLKDGVFDTTQSLVMNPVLQDPEMQAAAVPPLIEILQREDPDLSATASEALGRIGAAAAEAAPVLTAIVDTEPEGALRTAAVMARARIAEALERQRTYVRFEDGQLTVRADEARLSAVLGEISSRAFIAVEFGDGLANRRISIEFSDLTLAEGLRQVLEAYDAFFYHRGDKGLQVVWVYPKGVGSRIQPVPPDQWASTKEIAEGLDDIDPERRAEALGLFIERQGRDARDEVLKALSDYDPWVRTIALEGALYEGIDLSPEMLTRLATTDAAQEVRFLALQGLANDPDAEWLALQALDDPSPHIRAYAENFLDRLERSENPPERHHNQTPPEQ